MTNLASAERLAGHALTNEELAAGLRNVCVEYVHRGILAVCLNDPRLTPGQKERARWLMIELYGGAK